MCKFVYEKLSTIAEGPRDALCPFKSFQLPIIIAYSMFYLCTKFDNSLFCTVL